MHFYKSNAAHGHAFSQVVISIIHKHTHTHTHTHTHIYSRKGKGKGKGKNDKKEKVVTMKRGKIIRERAKRQSLSSLSLL